MRRPLALVVSLALAGGVAAQPPATVDRQARLVAARHAAAAASARADDLARRAAGERGAADRVRAQEAALAARVTAAAADLDAARARVALVAQLLAAQRVRLDAAQTPVARLLAALQSLARRPTIVAIAQPGSVDDLVHLRAVLGSVLPIVRTRTEAARADLARTRALQAGALLAATALRDTRAALDRDRVALAQAEAAHRARSLTLGRGAMGESDRALALGENARDLVDRMSEDDSAVATAAELAALDGPLPRPIAPGQPPPPRATGVYRLAVRGRLAVGLDELSDAGVRSRGLTFAVAPGTTVIAPAGGVVRYARRFRDYAGVVIIDHGGGWTTLLTGLGNVTVAPGARVAMGAAIGRAGGGEEPRVTIELRRRGRPIDIATLVG